MPRLCVAFLFRAFSSAGEHFLHTEGVIGSIPVTPTIELAAEVLRLGFFIRQGSRCRRPGRHDDLLSLPTPGPFLT